MTKEEFIKAIDNNAITKQLKRVANKYGYELGGEWRPYITESGCISCGILPKDRSFRSFYPDINLNVSFSKTDENLKSFYKYQWEMGTTSYGNLEGEELDKYLEGIKKWVALYKELVKIDLYKLAVRPIKFDD